MVNLIALVGRTKIYKLDAGRIKVFVLLKKGSFSIGHASSSGSFCQDFFLSSLILNLFFNVECTKKGLHLDCMVNPINLFNFYAEFKVKTKNKNAEYG